MLNKKFENKENGDVVVIKQDDGVWFTLVNGAKIKKDTFFEKYTEVIDPVSFFNDDSNIELYANQLSKIDTNQIKENNQQSEPIIKRVDEIDISNNDVKQKMIDEFLEKQKLKEQELSKYKVDGSVSNDAPQTNNPNYPEFDPNIKRDRKVSDDYYKQELYKQPPEITEKDDIEDESFKFFKGFKKNHKITIELKFDEYIADPEFLKLMKDNFEADVIKYYTKNILRNITNDPKMVEEKIYNQINDIINGKKKTQRKRKPKIESTENKDMNVEESKN